MRELPNMVQNIRHIFLYGLSAPADKQIIELSQGRCGVSCKWLSSPIVVDLAKGLAGIDRAGIQVSNPVAIHILYYTTAIIPFKLI